MIVAREKEIGMVKIHVRGEHRRTRQHFGCYLPGEVFEACTQTDS